MKKNFCINALLVTFLLTFTQFVLNGCAKEDLLLESTEQHNNNSGYGIASSNTNDSPEIVINIENDIIKEYLNTQYDENNYTYTHITDYVTIEQTERKDYAEGLLLEWENIGENTSTEIIYATTPEFDDSIIIEVEPTVSSYKLCNLIPNINYWVKVINNHSSVVKQVSFATIGRRRLINLSVGFNCRDLGGIKTIDNRTIKYGLYFRGGELDGRGQIIDDYDHHVLEEVIKIKDVFDFRAAGTESKTPIKDAVYHSIPLYSMVGVYDRNNSSLDKSILNNYKACLEELLDCLAEGHPVYTHCQGGCDRSNTMSFLIMGVLGVSENDLALDYELSSFAQGAQYAYNGTGGMIRSREPFTNKYHNNYKDAIEYIKALDGYTLKDKFENFWINELGANIQQINELREYMLSEKVEDNETTGIHPVYYD